MVVLNSTLLQSARVSLPFHILLRRLQVTISRKMSLLRAAPFPVTDITILPIECLFCVWEVNLEEEILKSNCARTGKVAQLVGCLTFKQEAMCLIHRNTIQTRCCGNWSLWSQHLIGKVLKIRNSRSFPRSTERAQSQAVVLETLSQRRK